MRLIIAEDCLMFREAIARACRDDFGHAVIAATGSGLEAVRLCRALVPDVLLLDLQLADIDGFDVVAMLASETRVTRLVLLSAAWDDYTLLWTEGKPIAGFLDKRGGALAEIGRALAQVGRGRTYFSPQFQQRRAARFSEVARQRALLTSWQASVLSQIATGRTDREIAEVLKIAPRTAQGHRSLIMRKLGIRGTPKLMAYALARGYAQLGDAGLVGRAIRAADRDA